MNQVPSGRHGRGPRNGEAARTDALASIAAFTLRARRVAQHSLAQDRDELAAYASGTVIPDHDEETGETYLVIHTPPEEQLESAAARVRPLILHGDPVHHQKVTSALGLILKNLDDKKAHEDLRELRRRWSLIDPRSEAVRGYSVQVMNTSTGERTLRISDNTLAFAWVYGDVVHADSERRSKGAHFGVAERYRAAVPVVCQIMVTTINTLWFIGSLIEKGILTLPPDVWSTAVSAPGTVHRQRATLHVSDPSTLDLSDSPQVDDELGPKWTLFGE